MHDRIMQCNKPETRSEAKAEIRPSIRQRATALLMDDRVLWFAFFGAFAATVSAQLYHFLWHKTLPPLVWGAAFGGGALGGTIGYFRRKAHFLRNDREHRIKQLINALGQAARK
jgi:hypothetical protein